LSRKFLPKSFNTGQDSWHAVQRNEYLRANAGIADAGETKTNITTANTANCRITCNDPFRVIADPPQPEIFI
jgi:hypothetical protein